MAALACLQAINLKSLQSDFFVFLVKTLRKNPLDVSFRPIAWESRDLHLCLTPQQLKLHPLAAFQIPSIHG